MTETLDKIDVCVFDAYGTLLDVHSATARHRERIGAQAERLSALWRQKQLEYTWLRSLMRCHADFEQVTRDALSYALQAFAIADPELEARLLGAYRELEAYPEVRATLESLRGHGIRTAILSNGSPGMLAAALRSSGLADLIETVLSVEDVKVYKPDPAVYRLAAERLGAEPGQIAFFSGNGWDVAGAACFGYRAVWVNRLGQPRERLPYGPAVEIANLNELVPLLSLAQ